MIKAFDYQKKCLSILDITRQQGERKALVVMATALGKTVTAALDVQHWLAQQKDNKRIMYLCHQNDILYQAKATFEAVLGHGRTYGYFHQQSRMQIHLVRTGAVSFPWFGRKQKVYPPHESLYFVHESTHKFDHAQVLLQMSL